MKLKLHFISLLFPITLFAQDQPCIAPERPKYATGPHPKASPIFPGCESFKENNDSLNSCFGRKISQLIAEKLDKKYGVGEISDSLSYYQNKVRIYITQNGSMKLNLVNKFHTQFENILVQKLNEVSNEIIGIIPAKYEGNYCAPLYYTLPLTIKLSEDETSQ